MVDRPPSPRRAALAAAVLPVLPMVLAACSGRVAPELLAPAQRLTTEDFVGSDAPSTAAEAPIPVYTAERPRAPRVAIRSITEQEARGGVEGIDVAVGEPTDTTPGIETPADPRPGDRPAPPADVSTTGLALVDAKVGDLNGVPIIARVWLEPVGDRLRAESAGKTRAQWGQIAYQIISERMNAQLSDEILLAEARASLTNEQKAGLRVFLSRFEQDVVRGSYGSATLADEQLRAASGRGLDEAIRQRERDALIETESRKIRERVQVPWRYVQREYERRYDEFNPDPRAEFRLIRLSTGDEALIAEFTSAIENGDFNTVADDERNGLVGDASAPGFDIETTYQETTFFGVEDLQNAAVSLSPGEYAGPIARGPFTYWIYLDRIDEESRSLYDVQRQLVAELREERGRDEFSRYLNRLFERAGITNIDELVIRLVIIAERWYYEGDQG